MAKTLSSQKRKYRLKALLMSAIRSLERMPLSEFLRIAETPKGRADLLAQAETMARLIKHIHAAVGQHPPSGPQESGGALRKRAKKLPPIPKEPGDFNGTLASLADCYRAHAQSSFHKLRHKTRRHYNFMIAHILAGRGHQKLAELGRQDIDRLYAAWMEDGKVATAHAIVTVFRIMINFGAAALDDKECQRLSGVLNNMTFAPPKPRNEHLTEKQVIAIRKKANELGQHSVALAQAFQFDLMLRQKDVVGEWIPQSDPGMSDVLYKEWKWVVGIRWDEIDGWILRHTTSKRQPLEIDLRSAPMVMEELARFDKLPASGPIIVDDKTRIPYKGDIFRKEWRKIANDCGIPPNIRNMDSVPRATNESGRKEPTLTARLVGSHEPH